MLFDSWNPQFCLACDKQVQMDDDAYCSESCRLADFEKTSSMASSQASSPGFHPTSPSPWSAAASVPRTSPTKFYLAPAYDFANASPYGQASIQPDHDRQYTFSGTQQSPSSSGPLRNLSPSSSHSSLCSIRSTSSAGDANQVSDKARKELQAYAVSFEQVRLQRRRSY